MIATIPTAEELDAYLHLTPEEIARLVLYLLVEEALKSRLSSALPDMVCLHIARHFKDLSA